MNKITRESKHMNTTVTVTVVQDTGLKTTEISSAIEDVFTEFDRIVKKFTRFNQDSELSNLNRNAGKWVRVSEEFFMLIEKMLELSTNTDGAFDPTVIDFLETYGYDPNYDFSKLDNPELDDFVKGIARVRPTWKDIQLDAKNSKVRLVPGQRLDLGGIGKGYAIDQGYQILDRFPNFLIDAGGDIRVKGVNPEGKPWTLGLKHKQLQAEEFTNLGNVNVTNLAIACSGSWARRVKQFHHIIDPRTGKPSENFRTIYIAAPNAAQADSWATAVFVGGREMLDKLPEDMSALLIGNDDKAIISDRFPEIIN